MLSELQGKTILITGGTGSFGRRFARYALESCQPHKVIIFSRDEWKQWEMRQSAPIYDHDRIEYMLGDVRDRDRLTRAFDEVDIVIHAAALKQVPMAEYNPSEYVKTNISGAMNVIDAAMDCGVSKVLGLSTAKACHPINLYGATKLCSDKLFIAANNTVGRRAYPKFSVVRYGNVLATRGSIIPLWQKLLDEGATELPITDARMTRFWITLDQAADFVASSIEVMRGGEIFVPKIPSMKIVDLAEAIAPGVPRRIVGIREGEKLHEMMIGSEDTAHTFEFSNYYVIAPRILRNNNINPVDFSLEAEGKAVARDFVYASDSNTRWLGVTELCALLGNKDSKAAYGDVSKKVKATRSTLVAN